MSKSGVKSWKLWHIQSDSDGTWRNLSLCGFHSPTSSFFSCFLSVHIHDTDYCPKESIWTAAVPSILHNVLHQWTTMLHECNLYIQLYTSLRNRATSVEYWNNYQMMIQANERPSKKHVRRKNGPKLWHICNYSRSRRLHSKQKTLSSEEAVSLMQMQMRGLRVI